MPWYQTDKPMISLLRALGIQRPQNADPSVSDDIAQSFVHDVPGRLAGWPMYGLVTFNRGPVVGFPSAVEFHSNARGGAIIHEISWTNNTTGDLMNVGFALGGALGGGGETHIGGRQNEEEDFRGAVTSPFGTLSLQTYGTARPEQDGHTSSFFCEANTTTRLNAYIPPERILVLQTSNTDIRIQGTVLYELLPYERSASARQ